MEAPKSRDCETSEIATSEVINVFRLAGGLPFSVFTSLPPSFSLSLALSVSLYTQMLSTVSGDMLHVLFPQTLSISGDRISPLAEEQLYMLLLVWCGALSLFSVGMQGRIVLRSAGRQPDNFLKAGKVLSIGKNELNYWTVQSMHHNPLNTAPVGSWSNCSFYVECHLNPVNGQTI